MSASDLMRTLILHKISSDNFGRLFLFISLLCLSGKYTFGQWVNNPDVNTLLVSEVRDPINITSVEDLNGGAFIFWEDNRFGFQNDIYFLHLDGNGKVTFRVDGKKISDQNDVKERPAAVSTGFNSAIVIWKSKSGRTTGNLLGQKVSENGSLLWSNSGVQITSTNAAIIHYAIDADILGNSFIAYTEQEESKYDLHLLKVNSSGVVIFNNLNQPIVISGTPKSMVSVIADNAGGAYLLWQETENFKSRILALHIDQDGKSTWGKNPISLSGTASNIVSYSAKSINDTSVYLAWQVYKKGKSIYHQLVSKSGKLLWHSGGRSTAILSGDQVNPQVLTSDSSVLLSWTQEWKKNRDVYVQKYTLNGEPLWGKEGVPVIQLQQDQFGQKIVTDGSGGAIITWIDRRDEKKYENLYAQRINKKGKLVWDNMAIPVASHPGSEKSYLSVISDSRGGIIAIFKDKRESQTGIFAQKVFNTGTYISQIVGFQSVIDVDSVTISWYSANETGVTIYEIERNSGADTTNGWEVIKSIESDGKLNARKFEVKDKPLQSGTIYYRLIQTDAKSNIQPSDIVSVNYFRGAAEFSLAQNTPNPFTDSTKIKFYLPKEMSITLEFFDSHIEKVGEVKNSYPAGENEIVFNASGLQQGIYFYRFEAGDFVDVKKMVVVN